MYYVKWILLSGIFYLAFSDTNIFKNSRVTLKISNYKGDLFPKKYFEPDELPTENDLDLFVNTLYKTVNFFNTFPNETDLAKALGLYCMQAVLKRTQLEYGENNNSHYITIKNMIGMSQNVLAHHHYKQIKRKVNWKDDGYRSVLMLFRSDMVMVNTVGNFTYNRLKKWIHSDIFMNNYTKKMDEATLDRYNYSYIGQVMEDDYPNTKESNYCFGRIIDTREPKPDDPFERCRQELHCLVWLSTMPSTAYSLNHRLFNILLRHLTRRCYLESKEIDDAHMDLLCAAIYREAVYIARRGFFARDVFLEHVSFCGYRGHLEFYRVSWFRKIASWINEQGCMNENPNFSKNLTVVAKKHMLAAAEDEKYRKQVDMDLHMALKNPCHIHPMAVSTGAMANAIRYSLYYLRDKK